MIPCARDVSAHAQEWRVEDKVMPLFLCSNSRAGRGMPGEWRMLASVREMLSFASA